MITFVPLKKKVSFFQREKMPPKNEDELSVILENFNL